MTNGLENTKRIKNHYVYRITNTEIKKHYYGVRSSILEPREDLGHKYHSSSTDREFIKDQKENPHKYNYKIIKTFTDRKGAEMFETRLHERFQVQTNESFYNKAINTNMGFSVVGVPKTAEHKAKLSAHYRGKSFEDRFGEERAKEIKGKLRDREVTEETREKIRISKLGMKLTDKHCRAISNGLYKRYSDDDFLKRFTETMTRVNKYPIKRQLAGQKIKEKWKDPEYIEKMKNRSHGSNSKSLKEKWKDPVWKKNMLESRKDKCKQRLKRFNIFNNNGDMIYKGLTIKEANEIWNNLHRVTKVKPLGSTRQSLTHLENKNSLHLKGYYSQETK